jgi:DNA-binding PadR family transcriptional regulator
MDKRVKELTMLLISLTGWNEDSRKDDKKKVYRAYIGYRYEVLRELEDQGLIRFVTGGKSLTVTEQGKKKARELKKKRLDKNQ